MREDNIAKLILDMCRRSEGIKKTDNKKLLWMAKKFGVFDDEEIFSLKADIIGEIENRLYPEYDGEKVTWEKWGWQTYQGEIRYIQDAK